MKKMILSLITFSTVNLLNAQQISIDLGLDKPTKQNISPGSKEVLLLNAIPGKVYKVTPTISNKQPAVLTNPFNTGSNGAVAAERTANLDDVAKCPNGTAIRNKINAIKNKTSETEIKKAYEDAKKDIDGLSAECKKEALELLKNEETKIQSKTYLRNLKYGQKIILTIERFDAAGATIEKVWEVNLETEDKASKWLVHYGFTYQPNIFSKYDHFFSKADTANANRFTITKKNGNQTKFWENLSPTIMFTYPFGSGSGDAQLGFSAIASTNFSTYSAGAGFSLIIGYNVNLSTGVMFTQKSVLNGQYKEGDLIRSNLTFDQLHEKKWGPEMFFTIGLRFDKNPFAAAKSEKKESNSNSSGNTGGTTSNGN